MRLVIQAGGLPEERMRSVNQHDAFEELEAFPYH